MIDNSLTQQAIDLKDLKEGRKYNLTLVLSSNVYMTDLTSSQVIQEITALNYNCSGLDRPLNYFITEKD